MARRMTEEQYEDKMDSLRQEYAEYLQEYEMTEDDLSFSDWLDEGYEAGDGSPMSGSHTIGRRSAYWCA